MPINAVACKNSTQDREEFANMLTASAYCVRNPSNPSEYCLSTIYQLFRNRNDTFPSTYRWWNHLSSLPLYDQCRACVLHTMKFIARSEAVYPIIAPVTDVQSKLTPLLSACNEPSYSYVVEPVC
jgi:hypothetical protein